MKEAQKAHRTEWKGAAKISLAAAGKTGISAPNIAATKEDLKLKCLHAHFAWFLVHPDYLLGRIICRELGELWCSTESCRQLTKE